MSLAFSSPSSLKDPPSVSEAGDDDDDDDGVLLQRSEASPMLSCPTIDLFWLNGVLENDGENTAPDSFPQPDPHTLTPTPLCLENDMDSFNEEISADTEVHLTLQEFLNSQNLLNSLDSSTPENIYNDFGLGYPNMPLTP